MTLGVGENVSVYFNPAPPVGAAWTATAGSLSGGGSGVVFTAPGTGGGATVTANVRGATFPIDFSVIEPSGVTATIRSVEHFATGVSGAGMFMNVVLQPTTVSFYQVQMEEIGEDASGVTGYYLNHPPGGHTTSRGANQWHSIGCDNLIGGSMDHAWWSGDAPPWSPGGSFTWPIPAIWKVGNGSTHPLPWSDQTSSLGADGTMTVNKLGHSVSRTTQDVITSQ
jgi:hypothetical protein